MDKTQVTSDLRGSGNDSNGSGPLAPEESIRPGLADSPQPTLCNEASTATPQLTKVSLVPHPESELHQPCPSSSDPDALHSQASPIQETHVRQILDQAGPQTVVQEPSASTDKVAYYERFVTSSQSERSKQRLSEESFNNPHIYSNPLVLEMIRQTVLARDVDNKKMVIEGIEAEKMRIYSSHLLNILPDIVGYYPSYSLRGINDPSRGPIPCLELSKPYRMLSGIRDEISQFAEDYENVAEQLRQKISESQNIEAVASEQAELEERTTTVQHIRLLEKELDKLNGPIQQEKMCHQLKPGVASFDMLWLLFRPGTMVVTRVAGESACARVYLPIWSGNEPNTTSYLDLKLWYLDFDGIKLRRREHTVRINRYDGLQRIDKLGAYPAEGFAPDGLLESLCDRGKRYWTCLQDATTPRTYDGMMVDVAQVEKEKKSGIMHILTNQQPKAASHTPSPSMQEHYDGVVMIDPVLYAKEFGEPRGKTEWLDETDIRMGSKMEEDLQKFTDVDPRTTIETSFDEIHYQLMPQWIRGFAVGTRKWMCFDVALLEDYKPDATLIESLILEPTNLKLIKSVASHNPKKQRHDQRQWQQFRAERIGGKGEGRIILMHGPPGTGKTFAAECVAEWLSNQVTDHVWSLSFINPFTGRPLLRLTCGELGLDPTRLERKLWQWFRMGEAWGTPLLIDEADVYVSARRSHAGSLEQNTIVAVFLRAVEYYRGLLFLTTNAVLTLDSAVISRVSIVVHFKSFSHNDRNELVKRTKERFIREYNCDFMEAAEDLIETWIVGPGEVEESMWNGREIINAFQTMIAMAAIENPDKDSISILKPHVELAIKNVQRFHAYQEKRLGSTRDEQAKEEGLY